MNTAIFFTSRFPFKTVGENFFSSELNGISARFDKVYIVTANCHDKSPQPEKSLPENTVAVSSGRAHSAVSFALGAVCLPFCGFFWREIAQLKKENKPFLPGLKNIFYSGSYYLAIRRRFSFIRNQLEISPDDHVTVIGYWLNYVSMAALSFRDYLKMPGTVSASRAHGSADVFNVFQPSHYYPFQAHLAKNLDAVFSVSRAGYDFLNTKYSQIKKLHLVYIGSYGSECEIIRTRAPFTVMTCSNLFPLKRVGLVIKAVRLLCADIPDIRWVHFGDGPQRAELETMCAGIEEHVCFKGYTPHSEVLEYLSTGEASVFVSASATEGLPISVVEATGFCLPVIATDVGSTRETAIDNITGRLIPKELTPELLAGYIKDVFLLDIDKYDALCKKAYEYWQQNFDCRKSSAEFAELLFSQYAGGAK